MATAPISRKLNLTRDQLSQFLTDQQQIRQFELLFATVDQIAPDVVNEVSTSAESAMATAIQALSMIALLSQNTAIEDAVLNAKVQKALDDLGSITQSLQLLALAPVNKFDDLTGMNQSLDLLALAPVRNNIELAHDVNGILPYANQTPRVRSNQVLTWLSM